jgi:hypothetical protein
VTFERYTALLDEAPCTPQGLLVPGPRRGELRVVRAPSFAEFRARQATPTPRLDFWRNRLAILTWTLEREGCDL